MDKIMYVKSGTHSTPKMIDLLFDLPPSPFVPITKGEFKSSDGYEVGMNCAAVANARSAKPVLGTFGVVTCMGIALFNRQSRTGGLTHLSQDEGSLSLADAGREILKRLLKEVKPASSAPVDVRIAGPWGDWKAGEPVSRPIYHRSIECNEMIREVLETLNAMPYLRFLSADLAGKIYPKNFGVDTRRWDEGLIKGSFTGNVALDRPLTEEAKQGWRRGRSYIVEISDLPPAPVDDSGFFDGRVRSLRPNRNQRLSPPPMGK